MASRFSFSAGRAAEGTAPEPARRSGFSFRRPAERTAAADAGEPGGRRSRDTILFVCTGNVCRSAYGHHVFQALLADRLGRDLGGLRVASAGTGINQALQAPDQILGLAAARCPEAVSALTDHRPRALTASDVDGAALVLAATDQHLDVVLDEQPGAARRAFTMLEFARLCGTDGAAPTDGGLDGLVECCARIRDRDGLAPLDLDDPFRGSDADYEAMADQLQPALETITSAVVTAVRRRITQP